MRYRLRTLLIALAVVPPSMGAGFAIVSAVLGVSGERWTTAASELLQTAEKSPVLTRSLPSVLIICGAFGVLRLATISLPKEYRPPLSSVVAAYALGLAVISLFIRLFII